MKGLDEAALKPVVARFYERVREDTDLGPIFNGAIKDWPEHIEKLSSFWGSVMLGTGSYKGNPVAAHLKHRDRISPQLFDRWLSLWNGTTAELLPADEAAALQEKAKRIAESLQLALFFRLDRAPPARAEAR